jgi:hypothetical protein
VAVSDGEKQQLYDYRLFDKGLYNFRTGQYADALAACRDSLKRTNVSVVKALDLTLEAMALNAAAQDGRPALAKAKALIDGHVPGIDAFNHDWLYARILYHEAERLIASDRKE